jgi:hypothetical protein
MQPSDLTIYAASLHGAPIRYATEAQLVPLCTYATTLEADKREQLKQEGWSFDDEEENISHLNPWFAELTAIFSIVHHDNSELVGNAQYRRRWKEDALAPSDENVLYVPEPAIFGISLAEQMAQGHSSFDGKTMMIDAAGTNNFPFTVSIMEKVLQQNIFHGCLMARGPAQYYKIFMAMLLRCMAPIWHANSGKITSLNGYDRRAVAFMAERMMTALILHREKLFNFEIMTAPIEFIGP